jgi:hypothetical protein
MGWLQAHWGLRTKNTLLTTSFSSFCLYSFCNGFIFVVYIDVISFCEGV